MPLSIDFLNARILSLTELPSKEVAELSLSLGRLALEDSRASSIMHKQGLFRPSMFHLQQSVEKSAKAFGLLMGILKPEDLVKEVHHDSVVAILLNIKDFNADVYSIFMDFLSVDFGNLPKRAKFLGKSMRFLQKKIEKPVQSIKPSPKIDYSQALKEIRDPKTYSRMWKATLDLDEKDELVSIALKALQSQLGKGLGWQLLEPITSLIGRENEKNKVKFIFKLYSNAAPKVLPLCILTMWHEQAPRYPPISKNDFWDPAAYNSKSPLVSLHKTLADDSLTLAKAIIAASEIVLKP